MVKAPKVMHGKRSNVSHNGTGLFKGLDNPMEVMRYHSLAILKPDLIVNAKVDDVIMGIQHKSLPIFGVQFHPESLGTQFGKKLLFNFLKY